MNLSGKEIGDESLVKDLEALIRSHDVDPSHMIFEITETAAITDLEKAIQFVDELRGLGFRFALDDFGVGFTSFLYLREINIDYLKIDGAFVRRLNESTADQGIVRAITSVAKGFGIRTIAEFVEKKETMDLLKSLGADYAQGFLIGRPGPEPVATYSKDLP